MTKLKTMKQIIRNRRLHFVSPDQMARQACKVMNNRKLGSLPVLDDNHKLVGMVSERDIVRRCIGEHRRTRVTPISEIMTPNPIIAAPGDSIVVGMALMMQSNIRHLPIVDQEHVLGCVSIREVMSELSYLAMSNLGLIDDGYKLKQREHA